MKHVLITGGNKGIGLETTKLFVDLGYTITVFARDISPIEGFKNCQGIKFDLQNISGISKLISELEFIDILINNAGIMNTCGYDNYPQSKKEEMIKINIEAQ
jgi:3-oxoacyl-[acyl-carrier protein] reductase